MKGVVPVAVPGLAHQMQRFQLLVRDANLGGICVGIGDSGDPQPSGGRGARDQRDDGLHAGERASASVDGDVGGELVLDCVPLL